MNKRNLFPIIGLAAAFMFSLNMFAQEKTEVSIQVKKDGKVVRESTFQFDDATEAEHAVKMMEILSGDSDHSEAMVFVDSLVWISEEEHDGDHENVFIIKSDDGETIEIMIEKDEDGNIVKKKKVKVMVSSDKHGTWHVDSEELTEVDEDVYVISGDDVKVELKEILEDHDGENIKVIVIKTKKKKQ